MSGLIDVRAGAKSAGELVVGKREKTEGGRVDLASNHPQRTARVVFFIHVQG